MSKKLKESIQKTLKNQILSEGPIDSIVGVTKGIANVGRGVAGQFRLGQINSKLARSAQRLEKDWEKTNQYVKAKADKMQTSKNPNIARMGNQTSKNSEALNNAMMNVISQVKNLSSQGADSASAMKPSSEGFEGWLKHWGIDPEKFSKKTGVGDPAYESLLNLYMKGLQARVDMSTVSPYDYPSVMEKLQAFAQKNLGATPIGKEKPSKKIKRKKRYKLPKLVRPPMRKVGLNQLNQKEDVQNDENMQPQKSQHNKVTSAAIDALKKYINMRQQKLGRDLSPEEKQQAMNVIVNMFKQKGIQTTNDQYQSNSMPQQNARQASVALPPPVPSSAPKQNVAPIRNNIQPEPKPYEQQEPQSLKAASPSLNQFYGQEEEQPIPLTKKKEAPKLKIKQIPGLNLDKIVSDQEKAAKERFNKPYQPKKAPVQVNDQGEIQVGNAETGESGLIPSKDKFGKKKTSARRKNKKG